MTKSIHLLSCLALLASCSGEMPTSDYVTGFKAAQKAEHDKGNVSYRMEGNINVTDLVMDEALYNIKATNIDGHFVLSQVPEDLSGIDFGFIRDFDANILLKAANFEVNAYPGTDYATNIRLTDPSIDITVSNNVAYADFTDINLGGQIVGGQAIAEGQGGKFKVTPWLEENPFDFNLGGSLFDAYIIQLFDFSKQGGFNQAKLDLDYRKTADLYVALKLAIWMTENGYDVTKDMSRDEVYRKRALFTEEIETVLTEDFHFVLTFTYNDKGMKDIDLTMKGGIAINALDYTLDEDEIETVTFDMDLHFHELGNKKFKPVKNPGDYREVRLG